MTVIGVAEPGFNGMDVGEAAVLWVPTMMKRQVTPGWDRLLDRRARWMHVFGRLTAGRDRGRPRWPDSSPGSSRCCSPT